MFVYGQYDGRGKRNSGCSLKDFRLEEKRGTEREQLQNILFEKPDGMGKQDVSEGKRSDSALQSLVAPPSVNNMFEMAFLRK